MRNSETLKNEPDMLGENQGNYSDGNYSQSLSLDPAV